MTVFHVKNNGVIEIIRVLRLIEILIKLHNCSNHAAQNQPKYIPTSDES